MTATPGKTDSVDSEPIETAGLLHQPRLGLGSTDNENIALRRNYREMELLWRKQKMLGIEQEYVMKIIDLHSKSIQVNYKRLTKKVGRIRSHLTEEEIKEMENDLQKKEFAEKYRKILRNQDMSGDAKEEVSRSDGDDAIEESNSGGEKLEIIEEEFESKTEFRTDDAGMCDNSKARSTKNLNHTSHASRSSQGDFSKDLSKRPETCPTFGAKSGHAAEEDALDEIIPSLEGLLDQLHNIKPQQFYENQRKLKLYDIQLLCDELDGRKEVLFKNIDAIVNWDKKEEEEDEEARKKREEEEESKKPLKRKTTFMRSVLRNFSMELMMKTMQYGWTDLGQCRYLRNRNDDGGSGLNTLAKDTMKIKLPADDEAEGASAAPPPKIEPGFDANGKMIRTADLLGLKSYD